MFGTKLLTLPSLFILWLAGLTALSPVSENPRVVWSFLIASAVLGLWTLLLALAPRSRKLALELQPRKQHYIQACAQGSVLLYWGWHWPQVYESGFFIFAQLLFAYAFDMLLSWSRRHTYTLGFGPFPVVFSINLFLWFKPDRFYLQFL